MSEKGSITSSNIYKTLNFEQAWSSQQLAILRASNLVETVREGKFIKYSINHQLIAKTNNTINNFFAK